jgi:putative PIN family toxin of toxin-antitoxin system
MIQMLRAVIDTNVLVSAVISDGKPRELLKKGTAKEFFILTSKPILNELAAVLSRPKFKTTKDEIHRIILTLILGQAKLSK